MRELKTILNAFARNEAMTLAHVPDGFDAVVVADLVRARASVAEGQPAALLHIARDSQRARLLQDDLAFVAPDLDVIEVPTWDCQPYDRVSPNASVVARRMIALSRLVGTGSSIERPRLVCVTINGALQRVPPLKTMAQMSFSAAPGNHVKMDHLIEWLEVNGFLRAGAVREIGDYAVRGGIIDLFAPGMSEPVRLDFFGDTLESIRSFDVESQRTIGQLRAFDLVPMSEVQLTSQTMTRFRQGYVSQFGAQTRGDALYEAVSEGRRHVGMEHWLPLFYGGLETIFDYLPNVPFVMDGLAKDAADERFALIKDYYDARKMQHDLDAARSSYKPLPPDALYMSAPEWDKILTTKGHGIIQSFASAEPQKSLDFAGRIGRSFAPERNDENQNVFEAAVAHIRNLMAAGRRVIIAGWSDGSRERLANVLSEHGLKSIETVSTLAQARALPQGSCASAVFPVEQGFDAADLSVIGEQDILGDRLIRQRKRPKRAHDFLNEVSSLTAGDLVVHVDHGIGRFIGLRTIEAAGVPHDCLELHYAGGDKLFVPVVNLELLSRYGSDDADAVLDRLGGVGWQTRKSKLRQRIRDMAHALIRIAAERQIHEAPRLLVGEGAYDEFCARFPYDETDDQQNAIDAVLDDLAAGKPMDRLVCGDVGFGKTEVALRAAFAAAMNGKQVAVVVPTTLLARQHYKTFATRFAGLPLRVAQISRMVSASDQRLAKQGIAEGSIDIVVGTHALLGKTIAFKDLGLVIIDEEQHFGVGHKERLKELRAHVHVLTLSATPIPRTLQLALTGVRELSIIATPPVDRLAVRTFVTPFDDLIIREALLRERYRGGQSFYVCPRIEDIEDVTAFLRTHVPEAKYVVAHGQMAAGELEDKMSAFYEGKYDVLVATAIVESGLDIPTANTLIVHRADMFGLAQLYQLRGRVGRSKTRAYALFTVPANRTLTVQAERRLKVLQSLDTLGAGFQLASHDLDIRGAGNLLGDEQSGHIKEVGYELYQQMLQEAIVALKAGIEEPTEDAWSPTISIDTPVTIPESYIADLQVRLDLYRRLSALEQDDEIESFAAEMIDRFGPLPDDVSQLLKLVSIKALCRRAHVEKVEAGPKGVIIAFRDNSFANPDGLVRYIAEQGPDAKVRPDMKIVFLRDFENADERLEGTRLIMRTLVQIAQAQKSPAAKPAAPARSAAPHATPRAKPRKR